MIAIENFAAETWMAIGDNGKTIPADCVVVGIDNTDDELEFVVMIESDGERWPALRDHVTAPGGRTYWPDRRG